MPEKRESGRIWHCTTIQQKRNQGFKFDFRLRHSHFIVELHAVRLETNRHLLPLKKRPGASAEKCWVWTKFKVPRIIAIKRCEPFAGNLDFDYAAEEGASSGGIGDARSIKSAANETKREEAF
ncbi:MAG: hypothetical protein Q9157_008792 [Trypethelium eluteriae]